MCAKKFQGDNSGCNLQNMLVAIIDKGSFKRFNFVSSDLTAPCPMNS